MKCFTSFFIFDVKRIKNGIINNNKFSRIKKTDNDKRIDISNNRFILFSCLFVSRKILKFLQAEKINADEIINLKSTDSVGYDKITNGYKIKCNAFLPDLSIVNCLVTVSME